MGFDTEDPFIEELFNSDANSLLVCGDNSYGQLLSNEKGKLPSPNLITMPLLSIDEVSSGSSHTFFRKESLLYCCGSNFFGQLGIGEDKPQSDLELVDFFIKRSEVVTSVTCRYNQTFFLTDHGKVYCCGFNEEGCLGFTPNTNCFTITEVKMVGGKHIQKIGIGMYHVLMLSADDTLFVSGMQIHGQLFLETKSKIQKSLVINKEMSERMIQDIGCGQYYSIVLSKQLKLWVSGVLQGDTRPVFLEYDLNKSFGFVVENTLPSLVCTATCCDDWFLVRVFCEFNLFLDKDHFFVWQDGKVREVTNLFNSKINEEVQRTNSGRKVLAMVSKSGRLFYLSNSDREIVDQSNTPNLFFMSVSHPFQMESFPDQGLVAVVSDCLTSK